MKKLTILALLAACQLPAMAPAARAELSPRVYEQMRSKAIFEVTLAVESVERSTALANAEMRIDRVTVRARILSIIRGAGLKKDATVTIRYTHTEHLRRGWVGPSPVPILEKGERVRAWLNPANGYLVPAARGWSFETLR